MPKSVNKTILALGGRADDSDSGVAALGLGDSRRSPISKEDEDMFAALFSSEQEVGERHQVAGQFVGHKPELPLLPHSSARDGSGDEANGNAKAEGEAQGKAKGKAKTKAKAKPKVEVQGGAEIDASQMWCERLVTSLRSDEPQHFCFPKVHTVKAMRKPRHKPR